MGFVFLIIGTIFSFVFLYFLFKGTGQEYMLESLEGEDFPFPVLYTAGLALQEIELLKLKGQVGEKIRKDSTLIYGHKYGEYYARIIWAQILSFVLFSIAIFFLLAGVMGEETRSVFVLGGVIVPVLFGYYFYNHMADKVKTRRDECEAEFPNAISKLALIVNSGVILHDAWKIVAEGNDGTFYDLMRKSCEEMDNGKSDIDAIYEFGVLTNSDNIRKFTSALIQSIERGGGNLPVFLANQSTELWMTKRQIMLQKGEAAASALLIPITLMLVGIMLIVIVAALQSFSL